MKKQIEFCKKYVGLSDSTLKSYIGWINRLSKFSKKDKATKVSVDDILNFRSSIVDLSARSNAVAYAAINTIYRKVLWDQMPKEFQEKFDNAMSAKPKQPKALPLPDAEILSKEEIQSWVDNVEHPMYRLCASMAYHTGAKLSEICVIPISAVKVNQLEIGDRRIPIPETIQKTLKTQKRKAKKKGSIWLFPSRQNSARHISTSSFQKILLAAKPKDISSGAGVRVFRASFIIHQFDKGVDPNWLAYSLGFTGPERLIPYMKMSGYL